MNCQRAVPKDDSELLAESGGCPAMCNIERRMTVSIGSIGGSDEELSVKPS